MSTGEQLASEDQYIPDYPKHIDYARLGDVGCHSAAIAFEMFRIGADEALWEPVAIDIITGRAVGEYTSDSSKSTLALLENGAELVAIRDFNEDRYVTEGRAYLEEYYQDGWLNDDPEGFNDYWTDERLTEDIEAVISYHEGIRPYESSMTSMYTQPNLEAIQTLLSDSFDVMISVSFSGNINTSHQIVVTAIENDPETGERLLYYFDNNIPQEYAPFDAVDEQYFQAIFRPANGILGIRKKQA